MSESQRVRTETEGGVRTLTLTRPEKKNAFDVEQALALWEAIDAASRDDEVRVLVVTAQGDYFSAGADVNLFLEMGSFHASDLQKVARLYEPLRSCRKPTIAMLQGHCVGMGVTVLPHFDLVYAADHVTFTTPFVKLGLVLEYGSSQTLAALIGPQRAKELILRATPLDARTAADWGLVTRLFGADALRDETMKIAHEIAANPPGAVRESLRLLDRPASFEEAVQAEDAALAERYGSEENVEAVTAILQRKRK